MLNGIVSDSPSNLSSTSTPSSISKELTIEQAYQSAKLASLSILGTQTQHWKFS